VRVPASPDFHARDGASIRVVIIDQSELIRRGIRDVLASASNPTITVVADASNAAHALAACVEHKPDLVILDLHLHQGRAISVCRDILRDAPATRILGLTEEPNESMVYDAMVAGVSGYLTKHVSGAELVDAITDVASGRAVFSGQSAQFLAQSVKNTLRNEPGTGVSSLSLQQRQVLRLVADGLTNREVGERLQLSENTVRNYLVRVFEKLGVKRRAQAAALMVQHTGLAGELVA
jgi:two-component system response regulator DevR